MYRHPPQDSLRVTDFDGELFNAELDHFLIANDVQHVVVPKVNHDPGGEWLYNGIGDIDHMTKSIMTDKNVSSRFWDLIPEDRVSQNVCPNRRDTSSLQDVFFMFN